MQNERLTYMNGTWVPESQASIHIYDSGFMFGDGVFEMFRTFQHIPFLDREHIERLLLSMKSFMIPIDKSVDDVITLCNELMLKNADLFKDDEYRIMINVTRGPLSIYKDVFELQKGDVWQTPSWIINAWPLSKTAKSLAHLYGTGINAVTVPQLQIPARFLDPKIKSRSRAHLQIASLQAAKHGADAYALLLDDDGFICEGSGSNFMIVKKGSIIIPEQRNMLRGCSMKYITDVIAYSLGINVIEKNIELYDVLEADEAMFTGTFTNLIPCNRLNGTFIKGRELDKSVMGPITKLICEQWAQNVGVDFIQQVKDWAHV